MPVSSDSKSEEEVYMTQISFEEQVWQLFFDGASRMGLTRNIIARVGILFLSP